MKTVEQDKLAHSTPTRPLELPPFSLTPLLAPVFLPPSSRPTSPSKQPPGSPTQHSTVGRLGQLVSSVAAGAGAAAGVAGGGGDGKQLAVRSVEAGDQHVWIGASDGRIRLYEISEDAVGAPPSGLLSPPPGSPSSPGRRTPTKQHSVLEYLDEVVVTPTKKAADRIVLLPRLDKAVLLSEGVLTFHALPNLNPLPVSQFPAIKGVAAFALDEDELAGGGQPESMQVCVTKRRTVHWLRVTNEGISSIKDLPLRGGAVISILRHGRLCIADTENYSIVDLDAAEALPLLPISQIPHPDPLPTPASSTGASTPPAPGGPDPRQRPAIACVAENEFLVASHTGSTTLGVFVNESGEPCRGTLEWASNLRSLVVDGQYTIALLHNNSVEIHSIHSQEIVQVVTLPSSSPSSAPPSPFSFQPRSLAKSWLGLELGAATGANKLEPVGVPLLASSAAPEPPSTPTRRRRASTAASVRSGLTLGSMEAKGKPTTTRVLVVGRNGLYGLTPLTLVVQADALIEKGRETDALKLAEDFAESAVGGVAQNPELTYVYLRLAFLSLGTTSFQEAFNLFLKAAIDPRILVRMFPDLRHPLIAPGDEVEVLKGVRAEVAEGKTIDEYILDSLNRNYSPHLQPSVEAAASTVELRASLTLTARDCLLSYLMKWRAARRSGEDDEGGMGAVLVGKADSRKVDMVVDTTLVKLLAEQNRPADITVLLSSSNDCVLPEVEPSLLSARLYDLLSTIYLERGEVRKTLQVWSRVVDGEYEADEQSDVRGEKGVRKVFELVWKTREKELTEQYGLWLLKHDQALALKLFTDPKQTLTFDTRDLFAKMSKVDEHAADMFLEVTVLQERDTDSRLHADLVKRYIGRLGEMLADSEAKAHLREQESAYTTLTSSSSSAPSFLSFLSSRYDSSSPHAALDRVRLKALLFLGGSSKYDLQGAKADLEEMEIKGLKGLTLERAVVYGKLRLDRQALSLLLHTLHDLPSAETLALQSGNPLSPSDISAAATKLDLPFKRPRKALSPSKREEEERRKQALARLLVEMCLTRREAGEEGREGGLLDEKQTAQLLETQAVHLDSLEVLPLLPDALPIRTLRPYLTRSLRRTLHTQQEASILKALASAQNLAVQDHLLDLQARQGPTVQLTPSGDGAGAAEKAERVLVVDEPAEEGRREGGEKTVTSVALDDTVELDLR